MTPRSQPRAAARPRRPRRGARRTGRLSPGGSPAAGPGRRSPEPFIERSTRLTGVLFVVATAVATGCVPPRDANPEVRCTVNSQCPADGLHFCDLNGEHGVCKPCFGSCPTAGALDAGGPGDTGNTGDAENTGVNDTVLRDAGLSAEVDALGVPDLPDAATIDSCAGWCGRNIPAPGHAKCYCDKTCDLNGECCPDFEAACPAVAVGPPAPVTSCRDRCGEYDAKRRCQCDGQCTSQGNCCTDYRIVCPIADAGSSDGQAADADAIGTKG